MYSSLIPHSCAHACIAALMYSGPLSQRITSGLPLQEMICLSSRITRYEGKEKSTSITTDSRLKSSMTLNNLNVLPSASWSCMKSIDHTWLIPCGITIKKTIEKIATFQLTYINKKDMPVIKRMELTVL